MKRCTIEYVGLGSVSAHDLRSIALQESPIEILRAAMEATGDVVPDGLVFAAIPEGDVLRIRTPRMTRDPRFETIRIRRGLGLGGFVMEHGESVAVDNYANDSRITRDFKEIVSGGEGLYGIVCVPVIVGSRVCGLLYGGRPETGALGGRAIRRLEDAAHYAAIGMENASARRRALEIQRLRDRERLAHELHDSVAQMLFGIGVAAQQSLLDKDPTRLLDAMREIETTASQARRELRQTLEQLAECDEGVGFEARLEGEVRLLETTTGCTTRVARSGSPRLLPDGVEDLVIDTVVEGVRNAIKHAGASFVLAAVEYEHDGVKVAVQSEAAHMPVPPPSPCSTGCGIAALHRRAGRLGGSAVLIDGEAGMKVLRLRVPTAAASIL
jgi:signal transduction histidine kinase